MVMSSKVVNPVIDNSRVMSPSPILPSNPPKIVSSPSSAAKIKAKDYCNLDCVQSDAGLFVKKLSPEMPALSKKAWFRALASPMSWSHPSSSIEP